MTSIGGVPIVTNETRLRSVLGEIVEALAGSEHDSNLGALRRKALTVLNWKCQHPGCMTTEYHAHAGPGVG